MGQPAAATAKPQSSGNLPSINDLSKAAAKNARSNGLTAAGRSLQKHSDRPNSAYRATDKKYNTLNREAQEIVDDILTNTDTKIRMNKAVNHGKSIDIIGVMAPDGRGLRYDSSGSLIGFREPNLPKNQQGSLTMMEFSILSTQDRDDLYAELVYDNVQWGEIKIDKNKNAKIVLYPIMYENGAEFELNQFIDIIKEAKDRLFEVEGLKCL